MTYAWWSSLYPYLNQFFMPQSVSQRSGFDYVQSAVALKPEDYLCSRLVSKQQDGSLSVRMAW
jgi:hypothetical protein